MESSPVELDRFDAVDDLRQVAGIVDALLLSALFWMVLAVVLTA